MESEQEAMDQFGRLLMQGVRDSAIVHWDKIMDGRMKGSSAQRATERLTSFSDEQREIICRLLADVTDTVIRYLLWTLEQESDRVTIGVRTDAGEVANLAEVSGEFSAELYSEDGWIARFSRERHYDILND